MSAEPPSSIPALLTTGFIHTRRWAVRETGDVHRRPNRFFRLRMIGKIRDHHGISVIGIFQVFLIAIGWAATCIHLKFKGYPDIAHLDPLVRWNSLSLFVAHWGWLFFVVPVGWAIQALWLEERSGFFRIEASEPGHGNWRHFASVLGSRVGRHGGECPAHFASIAVIPGSNLSLLVESARLPDYLPIMSKANRTAITPTRSDDFPEWYQQVVRAADLAENSEVRGCMVIKPWGYGLWEKIQRQLDQYFKETGHKNAYFPLLIPLSYLEKEAEHAEGFATECAVVTHHRLELRDDGEKKKLVPTGELTEPYVIRPDLGDHHWIGPSPAGSRVTGTSLCSLTSGPM